MRIDPPAPSTSAARAWRTAVKSMTPVDGDHSAATPVAAGSRSRSSPASIGRPCYAVGGRPLGQRVQPTQLVGAGCHDELAVRRHWDAAVRGALLDHVFATPAQACLQRRGSVVDACVQNAGVVAALVAGDVGLLVDHDLQRGPPSGCPPRFGQSHDAAPTTATSGGSAVIGTSWS